MKNNIFKIKLSVQDHPHIVRYYHIAARTVGLAKNIALTRAKIDLPNYKHYIVEVQS